MPLLAQTGCFNHADREAVARCPECGRDFCRECVTEHDGRVMCGGCLAKLARPAARSRRAWAWVGRTAAFGCGIIVAWFYFYLFGASLLEMPAAFHEGTIWKTPWADGGDEE